MDHQRYTPTLRSPMINKDGTELPLLPSTTVGGKQGDSSLSTNKKSWMLSMMYCKSQEDGQLSSESVKDEVEKMLSVPVGGTSSPRISQAEVFDLRREGTVKDIQMKLRNQESIQSPTDGSNRIGDFTGLVNKAKEGLNKSSSRTEIKSPGVCSPTTPEAKKAENDFQWEQLVKTLVRPLRIKDMDFTDLGNEDDTDVFLNGWTNGITNGGPPPPTPYLMVLPNSNGPPPPLIVASPPPPPLPVTNGRGPPPPAPPFFGGSQTPPPPPLQAFGNLGPVPPPPPPSGSIPFPFVPRPGTMPNNGNNQQQQQLAAKTIKKNKKTVKLFWKEVREDPVIKVKVKSLIWDELKQVTIDTQKLEHLFENRAKDLMTKKQQEMNRNKEIIVLDPKRSNAINIGMTKLPPPRTIKTAILKMDSTIMNREGIEKILTTMMPTEEEKARIMEAQMGNPDVPLGSAEQFLLTLASISELAARLKLWAFKLDYDVMEREVAEPLMDLKQGIEQLKQNQTFRSILATLLSIGNFLNGIEVKGFQIDYLAKVPEVKDTVHKHSLLHHLCHMVMEKFPDTSDLYSEVGAISRASKVDFDELATNLLKMETECKASWDHLKAIAKHDGSSNMKTKMSEFLAECAEKIIVLGIIHRRVLSRFYRFLLYLGIPVHSAKETKVNQFLKTVSEFALEYRTTRERVLQQLEKKLNHRERNKTRGKMITEVPGKFKATKDVQADNELRQLLGSGMSDSDDYKWGTVPGVRGRQRKDNGPNKATRSFSRNSSIRDENLTDGMTDGDDEILESLVKTATAPSLRSIPRERKRTRQADRKSLRRTLRNGLSEEEKTFLARFST